jgi:hypothetical protein
MQLQPHQVARLAALAVRQGLRGHKAKDQQNAHVEVLWALKMNIGELTNTQQLVPVNTGNKGIMAYL